MHKKGGALTIIVIGLIVLAVTAAVFFLLDIERSHLNLWALGFLVLSELILFIGLLALRSSKKIHSNIFLKAGANIALFIYFIVTLISIYFTNRFSERLNTFILIEVAIIALFLIVIILIGAFARGIEQRNAEDIEEIGYTAPKRGGF